MNKKTEASLNTNTATQIETYILLVGNEKVILDSDLATLYQVETRALVQAMKRNNDRFPKDFMFQLTRDQFDHLKSQTVTSSWGGRRTLPYAFTEQGVAMLSSVLRSNRAVEVNIEIMRAFVRLKKMLAEHKDLNDRIAQIEKKYDSQFKVIFDAIRQLMSDDNANKTLQIGFIRDR